MKPEEPVNAETAPENAAEAEAAPVAEAAAAAAPVDDVDEMEKKKLERLNLNLKNI